MKLFKFVPILLVISSCNKPNTVEVLGKNGSKISIILDNGTKYQVFEWDYRGHQYIVIDRNGSTGGITHAGHCRCRNIEEDNGSL
jgi:hypothetical protein